MAAVPGVGRGVGGQQRVMGQPDPLLKGQGTLWAAPRLPDHQVLPQFLPDWGYSLSWSRSTAVWVPVCRRHTPEA